MTLREKLELKAKGIGVVDSWLLCKLEDENFVGKGAYGLEEAAFEYLGWLPWKQATKPFAADFGEAPPELVEARCEMDAAASYALAAELLPRWDASLVQFVTRLAGVLARIELAGLPLDCQSLQSQSDLATSGSLAATVDRLGGDVVAAFLRRGITFEVESLTNDARLKKALFEDLKFPARAKTQKTGAPKLDKAVLQRLLAKRPRDKDLLGGLLEWRKHRKLLTTYVEAFLEKQKNGILHPSLFLGTRTWRRAGNNPNPQNLPTYAKKFVKSRFPGGKIGSHDYDQLEPRIMCWLAEQWDILDRILDGESIYQILAKDVLFGHEIDKKQHPTEYRIVKSVWLGVSYRMQAQKLSRTLQQLGINVGEAEAAAVLSKIWRLMPRIRSYQDDRRQEVLETGQIVTPVGVVRHLPHDGPGSPGFEHVVNQAVNVNIQCHREGTKVLTGDLRWVPIERLEIGERLLALDENLSRPHRARRWRFGIVEKAVRDVADCCEIVLENGDILCTTWEHLHLTANINGYMNWRRSDRLYRGANSQFSRLVKVLDVVEPLSRWDAGYMAGSLDADGHFSTLGGIKGGAKRVGLSQLNNELLAACRIILDRLKFNPYFCKHGGKTKDFWSLYISGQAEVLRLLSLIRPPRLLRRFSENIESFGRVQAQDSPRVVEIRAVGLQPIVRLQTSSHTYIAEGYATHNCSAGFIMAAGLILLEEFFLEYSGMDYIQHLRSLYGVSVHPFYPLICDEVHDEVVQDYPPDYFDLFSEAGKVLCDPMKLEEFRDVWPWFDLPLAVRGLLTNRWGEEG